jgi:hypothetical protein
MSFMARFNNIKDAIKELLEYLTALERATSLD